MIEKSIAIYVFLDDLFKQAGHKEDIRRKVNDSEVLTTAIISAMYFGGHMDKARLFMKSTGLIPKMLDKSRFNRRLHGIGEDILSVFIQIGRYFKHIAATKEFVLDSYPVPVCDNIRISRCRLVKGEKFRGRQSSMRRYFYGIKVQLLTTTEGIPVEFCIVPGSQADVKALEQLSFDLSPESQVYADSAYTNYKIEDMMKEADGVLLHSQRKSNAKRKDTPSMAFIKEYMRIKD